MAMSVLVDSCPRCGRALDMHLLGLCSLLGPPSAVCLFCGEEVPSGRREWRNMTGLATAWFVGVSLLYVGLFGFLGAGCVDHASAFWSRKNDSLDRIPDLDSLEFMTGLI